MAYNKNSMVMLLALGLWLTASLTGCVGSAKKMTETEKSALQPSGQLENGIRVIKMEAKKYEFIPDPVVVRLGEQIRLEVTSTDVKHGIAISAFDVNRDLAPGKTETITFKANKPGTFSIHCSVFCGMGHMSMGGDLIVLPADK